MDKRELAQYLLDEAEARLREEEEAGVATWQLAGVTQPSRFGQFVRDTSLGLKLLKVVREWAQAI